MQETEGILVHPNQEPAVIAGQGTIALEVLNQVKCHHPIWPIEKWFYIYKTLLIGLFIFLLKVPLVDALVVPVGGGGMVAGIAITIKVRKLLKGLSGLGPVSHCIVDSFSPCPQITILLWPPLPHCPFHV